MAINYVALGVAAVLAFVASSVWYVAFNEQRQRLLGADPAAARRRLGWKVAAELGRNTAIAAGVAILAATIGVTHTADALVLAGGLWVAFPLMILVGSVMWENVPWRLAALHAGDWLIKLLLMALIVTLWR